MVETLSEVKGKGTYRVTRDGDKAREEADQAAAPPRGGGLTAMKYILIYDSADDVAQTAPVHFAAHRARWKDFQADGTLLLIGPYSDQSGALAVFTTRAATRDLPAATRSC